MSENNGELDTLIQTKLDEDTDFQATLETLSDEEKESKVSERKSELVKETFEAERQARIKAEENYNNQKVRAEKAETAAKNAKPATGEVKTPIKAGDLSQTDMLAVLRANVSDEDLDEVKDIAAIKKISVAEALKLPLTKSMLGEKEEQRKTAQASNTGATKRGTSKLSDESLVSKAQAGEMPESEEDIARLWRLKKGLK